MVFKAIWLEQASGVTQASVRELDDAVWSDGDTLVRVEWSSLNYKDALAITGRAPVVRKFPMIPGIDFAGMVESSSSGEWQAGDRVVMTGWGRGETAFGGFAQKARVKSSELVRLPEGMDARSAMAIGTAGFTAMLAVEALERHGVRPQEGEVLVTGAGGGVGGFAVALLARQGFDVVAVTGRPAEAERLRRLGARDILPRDAFSQPGKPLAKERWAGVVDSVGSHTLANACASTRYGGTVAACGLAQGMDFPATVAPFILRGVTLAGIDSVYCPAERRPPVWQRLARDLSAEVIDAMVEVLPLDRVIPAAQDLLDGRVGGRVLVEVR
ncbi:oxidoreductase [Ramlibacter sp. AW1]|uniref:Oxidoreductase n=1 Tax=Ramlibacter aurantiacus TaxID=2801330 RepID=A0A937D0A0_9BURK|nr:MDR family oxidoreductase [Ramlibacter aurantiacus]MBL0419209.1 oxidoreductase [Ramlibacter aurantiacus]